MIHSSKNPIYNVMPNIYDAKIYGIRIGEDLTADYCEIDFMQKL